MICDPVRLGVVGLGRAFMLMLPGFRADPRIRLVAAAAPREQSRQAFAAEFGGRTYSDIEGLCAAPDIEAIYIATPHQMHCAHVKAAAAAGKHILVDKPLAISMADAAAMVGAAQDAGVHLIVGPSHSFDAPVAQARKMITSGALGRVRMIQALNYTDFLYRPRRPEELRTEEGGGVVFSQGVHQIDVVRLLAGGVATSVSAMTGAWDPARPTEGAYSALVGFEGGAFASLTYSGYAHFDSDEWMGWIGELGHSRSVDSYGSARSTLRKADTQQAETALKMTRTYGSAATPEAAPHHEHFGPVIVLCDRGDLRLSPDGLHVYGDFARHFSPAPPPRFPRAEVMDALFDAVRHNVVPVQTGAWGLASLELCHAILKAAKTGAPVSLCHQVPAGDQAIRAD